MPLALLPFNHTNSPTLAGGALLTAAGIGHTAIRTIGTITGTSSADGSFSDSTGQGALDYDASGNLYACDRENNRVQKFTRDSSGAYVYAEKVSSLVALGSSVNVESLIFDRARNELHLAALSIASAGSWARVWDMSGRTLSQITDGNKARSYGSNNFSAASNRLTFGSHLSLDGNHVIGQSAAGDFRLIRWNHLDGSLASQASKPLAYLPFTTDGAGNWFSGTQNSTPEPGLWKIGLSDFLGISRVDTSTTVNGIRRARFPSGTGIAQIAYYNGRIYARDLRGRYQAWSTSDLSFVDEFRWGGGSRTTEHLGHGSDTLNGNQGALAGRFIFVPGQGGRSDDLVGWEANASNNSTQSFLVAIPVSTATATWTYSSFSEGAATTLKGFLLAGTNLAAEKCKLEYRKNAGSWHTVPWASLGNHTYIAGLGDHEFESTDTLSIRVSLSVWDRLDGHASLFACRDKLTPSDVTVTAIVEDPSANFYVPTPTGAWQGRLGSGGFRGRLGA